MRDKSKITAAMLSFSQGFVQLAEYFGAAEATPENDAPAPVEAPKIAEKSAEVKAQAPSEKAAKMAVQAAPAPDPVATPVAAPAPAPVPAQADPAPAAEPELTDAPPLTDAQLRELTVRAFEAGYGDAVREHLRIMGVERVSQLDADARMGFRTMLLAKGVR